MRRLNRERGLTFLIVTHDISVGRATDRIVRMVDGEIVDEELLEVSVMVARVTLAEIDAVRMSMDAGGRALPRRPSCRRCTTQDGYEGGYVLITPEGKALVLTFWGDEEAADAGIAAARLLRRAGREVRDDLPVAARARDVRRRDRRGPARPHWLEAVTMTKLFGLPVGAARRSCSRRRSALALGGIAVARAAQPRLLPARRAQRAPPAGAHRADRRGLMLGTTIIAAALATGDTMSQTIRSSAIAALGPHRRDRRRARASRPRSPPERRATGCALLPAELRGRHGRRRACAPALVDGRRAGDRRAGRRAGRDQPPDRAAA